MNNIDRSQSTTQNSIPGASWSIFRVDKPRDYYCVQMTNKYTVEGRLRGEVLKKDEQTNIVGTVKG